MNLETRVYMPSVFVMVAALAGCVKGTDTVVTRNAPDATGSAAGLCSGTGALPACSGPSASSTSDATRLSDEILSLLNGPGEVIYTTRAPLDPDVAVAAPDTGPAWTEERTTEDRENTQSKPNFDE